MTRRIGILGGTFNPIHLAHLAIAGEARQACELDEVLFLVAADPPHKPIAGEVSFDQRLAMVKAALADYPGFTPSDLEAQRSGKSYSVDTLRLLRNSRPDDSFYFIIGLDSFRDLHTWKDYRQLFQLTNLVVVFRPGIHCEPLQLLPVAIRGEFCYSADSKNLCHVSGNTVIFLEETALDISSTAIRQQLAAGEDINSLVPAPVAAYIERHRLYRT